jgi:hypothetical protein
MHWNSWVVRGLVPSLDRNPKAGTQAKIKEFYLQRSERGHAV